MKIRHVQEADYKPVIAVLNDWKYEINAEVYKAVINISVLEKGIVCPFFQYQKI